MQFSLSEIEGYRAQSVKVSARENSEASNSQHEFKLSRWVAQPGIHDSWPYLKSSPVGCSAEIPEERVVVVHRTYRNGPLKEFGQGISRRSPTIWAKGDIPAIEHAIYDGKAMDDSQRNRVAAIKLRVSTRVENHPCALPVDKECKEVPDKVTAQHGIDPLADQGRESGKPGSGKQTGDREQLTAELYSTIDCKTDRASKIQKNPPTTKSHKDVVSDDPDPVSYCAIKKDRFLIRPDNQMVCKHCFLSRNSYCMHTVRY